MSEEVSERKKGRIRERQSVCVSERKRKRGIDSERD